MPQPSNNSDDRNKDKSVNVQVVVRSRPLNTREVEAKEGTVINCSPLTKEITYTNPKAAATKTFSFDAVYGPQSTQTELFDQTVRPIVDEVLKGFNCTLFAYGQTGTGKTYTMEGKADNNEHAGVIPRSIYHIFDTLERSSSEYTVRVSYLELYNEELRDLLSTENKQLRIYDGLTEVTGKKGCTVNNLEEIIVPDARSIFSVIENSCRKRQTAETLLNPYSSRSHCIFTITIHTKEATPDGEDLLKVGKLNLVDLAGSENILRSGAAGERRREAGLINTSLLTLGRVINALTEHSTHIPYRESKLTRLLQDSLGGKTRTCIIATISPAAGCMEETLSTLDYAHRAKNIRNKPEINQKMTRKALIKEYTSEIEKLKLLLRSARDKNGVYVPAETFDGMETELSLKRAQVAEVERMLETLKISVGEKDLEIEERDKIILSSKEELNKTTQQYNATRDTLHHTEKQLTTHKAYEHALLSNLDASLQDREQLFNKIERKKSVESTNRSTLDHAGVVLLEKVGSLEKTLEKAYSSQSAFFSEMEDSLSDFLRHKDEQIENLSSQSNLLAHIVSNASANLCSSASEMHNYSANALTALSSSAQQQSVSWADNSTQFYQNTFKIIAAIQDIITIQNQELKAWIGTQMKSIRAQSIATSSFLKNQTTVLQEISDQATALASRQQTVLQERQNSLSTFADSRVSSLRAWQSDFMTQIGHLIRDEVDRQEQQMKSEIGTIAAQVANDINDMYNFRDNVTSSVDTCIKNATQCDVGCQEFVHSIDANSCRFIEHFDQGKADLTHNIQQLERVGSSYTNSCGTLQQDFTRQMSEQIMEATNVLSSLQDTDNEHIDGLKNAISDWSTQMNAQTTSMSERIDQHGALCTKHVGISSSLAKQAHTQAWSLLEDLSKSVSLFALKEDLPTGVTPVKKPIPVPMLDQFRSWPHPLSATHSSPAISTPTHSIPSRSIPTHSTPIQPTPIQSTPIQSTPTPILILPDHLISTAPPTQYPPTHKPSSAPSTSSTNNNAALPSTVSQFPNTTVPSKIPKIVDKKKLSNKENIVNAK